MPRKVTRRETKNETSVITRASAKRQSRTLNLNNQSFRTQKERKYSTTLNTNYTTDANNSIPDNDLAIEQNKPTNISLEDGYFNKKQRNHIESLEVHLPILDVQRMSDVGLGMIKFGCNPRTDRCSLTPKSDPMPPALSPHRSSKTPKKSPKGLASPKTHSLIPFKLSRTPRKLSLTTDSPKVTKLKRSTPLNQKNLSLPSLLCTTEAEQCAVVSGREKVSRNSISSANKITRKSLSIAVKQPVRIFSKSPKIILRLSKRKSKNSMSPKRAVTTRKSNSPKKNSEIASPGQKNDRNPKPDIVLKTPVIVLQRLSPYVLTTMIDKSSGIGEPLSVNRTLKKRQGTDSETAWSRVTRRSSASKRSLPSKWNVVSSNARNDSRSTEPLRSSTPRGRKNRFSQLDNTSRSTRATVSSRKSFRTSPQSRLNLFREKPYETKESVVIEGEAASTIRDEGTLHIDRSRNLTISYDGKQSPIVDTTSDEKNRTYELLEPKTPKLREISMKGGAYEAELNGKNKRSRCRVRFASPNRGDQTSKTGTEIETENFGGKSASTVSLRSRNKSTPKASVVSSPAINPTTSTTRKENADIGDSATTPSSSVTYRISRRSNDLATAASTNQVPSSSYTLQNLDPKYSASKKVPNFEKIHKRMFAKSESLVDAKKRLEERHTALTSTAIVSTKVDSVGKSPRTLVKPTNRHYNRFGFRHRKVEAVESILNKRSMKARSANKKEENRAILKGVRTNRRFELQMKSRNIAI